MIATLFRPLEGPQIVKATLNLGQLRIKLRLLFYVLAISAVVYGILYGITPDQIRVYNIYLLLSMGYQACFVLIAPFLLFYNFYLLVSISSLKDREQRRQAPASGDQHFLSIDQPTSDIYALSLPFTVKLRPDWSIPLTFFIIMLPSMCVLSLVWSHFRPDPVFDVLPFIIAAVFAICFSLFLVWKLSLQKSIQLVVNENGLNLLGLHSTAQYLTWQDVRLFAIDAQVVFLKKSQPIIFFEIAGAHEVINWTWKLPGNSFVESSASFKEYDRQMQALFSLIAARTGLPLCDLRK